jgi:4-amino-4-deoxy-L-arabinose transferase-like glycosyltransferase
MSASLILLAASVMMWRLALQLFKSEAVAAGSVILFNLYPLTMLGLIVMTPDVPVVFFWCLGVYMFWQVLYRGQSWRWYPLGLVFGLALLSKYTAVLMAPCFLLYLLLTDERRWLKTVHPYAALLLGLAVFAPVVWWNSQNDWVSFKWQLHHGLGGNALEASNVAEFTAGQLVLTGPLVWLLGMVGAGVALVRKDKALLFVVCTSVPVIVFFGLTSLRNVSGANWPAFAYFSFSMLVSKYCLDGYSWVRRGMWTVGLAMTLGMAMTATLHARFSVLPLERWSTQMASADATNWFYGWRELGDELKKHPSYLRAVSPSHQLSAEIIYYTDANVLAQTAQGARPSQFNMIDLAGQPRSRDRLFVWTDADYPEYGSLDPAAARRNGQFNTYRGTNLVRSYFISAGAAAVVPTSLN